MAFPLLLILVIHSLFAGPRQAFDWTQFHVLASPREVGF
jgi:hypothetical protein